MTTLRNLNAVVLVVAMVGLGGCARGTAVARCRIGDLTASSDPESSKILQELGPWAKHARECDVGEYKIDIPAEGGHGEIMVSRHGHPLFLSAGRTTMVLDSTGKQIVFEATQGEGTSATYASYATRVADAWVDSVDFGADGSVDYRTTKTAGGSTKQEFSVDQRWLELVQQGDLKGVVLDGEFMTVAAARKRVAAKRESQAAK
jgi:hypothetical protein